MVVSVFSVLPQKTTATISSVNKSNDFSNFKTILNIPVSEEGIEYTGMAGYGSHEGPNAFDVKGDKVYILDNVHHRVLVYSRSKGDLIEKINIPEGQWIHGMAVDKNGKIYLFNAGLNTLITINNGTIEIASLNKEIRLEPFAYFGVSEKGPFVVLVGGKMKTCFLEKRQSGKDRENNLYVTEEKEGNMSSDGSIWRTNVSNQKAYINTLEDTEFPRWLVDKYSAYYYIGKNGFVQFWKITNDYGEWIVKLNSKTQNIEGLVKIPDVKYSWPQKDVVLDNGNIFVLLPCEKRVYVLMVDSWMTSEQYIEYTKSLESGENAISSKIETEQSAEKALPAALASSITRDQIISTAQQYNNYKWYCSKQNYDGSKVANPSLWERPSFITSYNTYYYQVPYCWGGWDSLSGFDTKIKDGYAAGNVCTNAPGYVGGTAGVYCSGFVSRCWGLSQKYNTTGLMNISTKN